MFKDLTQEQILEGLKKTAEIIPEGKKGALFIYGDRNELHGMIALKTKDGWEFDVQTEVFLQDSTVNAEVFFGIKKAW